MSQRDTRISACPACNEDVRQGKLGDGTWVPLVEMPVYRFDSASQSAVPELGLLVDHREQCRVIVGAREKIRASGPNDAPEGREGRDVRSPGASDEATPGPSGGLFNEGGAAATSSNPDGAQEGRPDGPCDSGEEPEPPIPICETCKHDEDSHAKASWGPDRMCLVPDCACEGYQ